MSPSQQRLALTAAIVVYPRFLWDVASALTLAGLVLGAPLLAWQLGRVDGLSASDTIWVAFALVAVGASHLWWRWRPRRHRRGSRCCGC